jgi:16S rRNA processing protein RimM
LVVGLAGKPHGLKGELRVHSLAHSPSVFCELATVYLRAPAKAGAKPGPLRPARVVAARVHGQAAIVAFEGARDRDQAEALRGTEILAAKRDLPDFDPDDIYLSDIMDSEVFTGETWDAAAPLGRLHGLLDAPAQEIWVIKTPDGREVLFPADPAFTRDLDVKAKKILIQPPPGLLELYLGGEEEKE